MHGQQGKQLMTGIEATMETLVSYGVTDVFGIVDSALMDVLNLFLEARIGYISTQHERNVAHMAHNISVSVVQTCCRL